MFQLIFYRRVPYEEQIKDLLRKKRYREAISLVEELDSQGEISKEMLSFLHAQIGYLLLFDLRFEEAVNQFLKSEKMEPSEIFPFIMRDPNRWSLLVQFFSPGNWYSMIYSNFFLQWLLNQSQFIIFLTKGIA